MFTVWKYEIPLDERFWLQVPGTYEMLKLDTKNGVPCLWALVDTEAPLETVEFISVGTGQEIPTDTFMDYEYIGTWQSHAGSFVWHIFQVYRGDNDASANVAQVAPTVDVIEKEMTHARVQRAGAVAVA